MPVEVNVVKCATLCCKERKRKSKNSFEPDLNQRPMDICSMIVLQSTALPTELSKAHIENGFKCDHCKLFPHFRFCLCFKSH